MSDTRLMGVLGLLYNLESSQNTIVIEHAARSFFGVVTKMSSDDGILRILRIGHVHLYIGGQ